MTDVVNGITCERMTKAESICKGLQILIAEDPNCEVQGEHDVIYAGVGLMSDDLSVKMEEAGWVRDNEFDCWVKFT